MLHVWGRASSINVRKVIWAVQEIDQPMQRTDAGGQFGLVLEDDYLSRNPNGLVPLLEDGAVRLWESNVIVRYLCAQYAPDRLYPQALPARFDAERWMDWQQTTFNKAALGAFWNLFRGPAEQRDDQAIAASMAATAPLLDLLDTHLATQPYLAGESFGMADIPLGCEVHRWYGMPIERETRPHLERWFKALQERPGARGILDIALS